MNITIDGVTKTLQPKTVWSQELHTLAGNPAVLKSNGKVVPNDKSPYDVAEGQVFTTR